MQEKALQLVSLTQAKKLKELGFDWEVTSLYDMGKDNLLYRNSNFGDWNAESKYEVSAPSIPLALKWFRDVKDMYIGAVINTIEGSKNGGISKYRYTNNRDDTPYNTYEEAESALLDALLEYCENNQEEK